MVGNLDNINTNVRRYKANDPYYYEVDNLPIEELEANDIVLSDNQLAINTELETKVDEGAVDAKIAAQYTSITQPWVNTNFFDVNELFEGPKMPGLSPRTSTGVYTREEIEWVPNGSLQNGNLFTQFLRSYIVDPTNLPVDSTGNAWAWGSGILLNFFYDKAEIDTITFNVSRLDTDEVDAIDATGSSSRVLVDSNQIAQLPTDTNPFVVQEQITDIKDSTETGNSISPTNKFIDAKFLRGISTQRTVAAPPDLSRSTWYSIQSPTDTIFSFTFINDWPTIDITKGELKGVFFVNLYSNKGWKLNSIFGYHLGDGNAGDPHINLGHSNGPGGLGTITPNTIFVEIVDSMYDATGTLVVHITARRTDGGGTENPEFSLLPTALVYEKPILV